VAITIKVKGSNFPMDTPTVLATKSLTSSTDPKQLHVRVRAREIILRVESANTGYGWTMGDFRFGLRTDGKR
jgi:hypothetical protein